MQEGIVIKGYGPILNSLIKCYNWLIVPNSPLRVNIMQKVKLSL
jgi:hypothetical protein